MNKSLIGARLKHLRGKRSFDYVSKKIGISKSALYMYERGERIPRDEIKVKLATLYETPVQKIFFENETSDQNEFAKTSTYYTSTSKKG